MKGFNHIQYDIYKLTPTVQFSMIRRWPKGYAHMDTDISDTAEFKLLHTYTNEWLVESYRITTIEYKLSWLLHFEPLWENEKFYDGRISHLQLISANENDTAHTSTQSSAKQSFTMWMWAIPSLAYDFLNTFNHSKLYVLHQKIDYVAAEILIFVPHMALL